MPNIHIVGWREGLLKISMTHLLQERLGLSLTDAKATVDSVVAGKTVSFKLETLIDANALRDDLERIGAIVELEITDESPRVSNHGET